MLLIYMQAEIETSHGTASEWPRLLVEVCRKTSRRDCADENTVPAKLSSQQVRDAGEFDLHLAKTKMKPLVATVLPDAAGFVLETLTLGVPTTTSSLTHSRLSLDRYFH